MPAQVKASDRAYRAARVGAMRGKPDMSAAA